MSNYMQDAFAPVDAHNHALVEAQTWGHLAPKPQTTYTGYIVFSSSTYNSQGVIAVEEDFENLPSSPWFFDDLKEFIYEKGHDKVGVYRFDGTYTKFKNGNCRFSGKIKKIRY